MSAVTPDELYKNWKLENIPLEAAMGQVLQNLIQQQKAQEAMNQTISNLRADVDRLIAHTELSPPAQSKRKAAKDS